MGARPVLTLSVMTACGSETGVTLNGRLGTSLDAPDAIAARPAISPLAIARRASEKDSASASYRRTSVWTHESTHRLLVVATQV
jgi:hypothetical protein